MDILGLTDAVLMNCSLEQTIFYIDEIYQFVREQRHVDLSKSDSIIRLLEIYDDLFGKIALLQTKLSNDMFDNLPSDNWSTQRDNLLNKLYSIQTAVQSIRESCRMWNAVTGSNNRYAELETNIAALQQTTKEELEVQTQGLQKTQKQLAAQTERLQETQKQLDAQTEQLQKAQEQLDAQTEQLQKAQEQFATQSKQLKKAQKLFAVQTQKIKRTTASTLTEIRGAEGKIISHVLTLMGVFTAVITIILSLVATSSSWLNNATSASAIIAFVVPNLVTLSAVVSLVLLIYIYHKAFYPPLLGQKEKPSKVPDFVSAILLLFILFATIALSVIAHQYADIENRPHIRFIIDASQYKVVENHDEVTNTLNKYFEFSFEGENYQFPYDEDYWHNSSLYYCTEHNTLE